MLLLLTACHYGRMISHQNVAYLYQAKIQKDSPLTWITHISPDSSRLYLKLTSDKEHVDEKPISIQLHGYRYAYLESPQILDSFSHVIEKSPAELDSSSFLIHVDFYTGSETSVLLLKYRQRDYVKTYLLNLDRSSLGSPQYFHLTHVKNGLPLMLNYHLSDPLKLAHFDTASKDFRMLHFPAPFAPAYPIYMANEMPTHSLLFDTSYSVSSGDIIQLSEMGLYFLQHTASESSGLSLYKFHEDYPKPTRPEHLLKSLRYISKNVEYKQMQGAKDLKRAIDKFWLDRSGSMERAKVLIKEYYTRVWAANIFFTSYKEGWMTDRGLVYIIFGPPDIIYKSSKSENWIYEEKDGDPILSLSFLKKSHFFTDNDFSLARDQKYENSWHLAVHRWRHGNIGSVK